MYIKPGKKSASWQLDAIVEGLETTQRGKKRRKIAKIRPKSNGKKCLNGMCNFLVAVVINFFYQV